LNTHLFQFMQIFIPKIALCIVNFLSCHIIKMESSEAVFESSVTLL